MSSLAIAPPAPPGFHQKRLDGVFWASLTTSTLLLIYSVASTRIDNVDEGVLAMASQFPPEYWVGVALLIVSTMTWYVGDETKGFHLLLVALLMGYVFLGPDLMEAHPRSVSSYAQAYGVSYVLEDRAEEFRYFPWLGFHYVFAVLAKVTGAGYLAMIRVGSFAQYFFLPVAFLVFFGRVLPDRRSMLIATLAALAMATIMGVSFTPHQMAFGVMLLAFAMLVSLDASPVRNRLLIGILFSIALVSHGLTALVITYVVGMMTLLRWKSPAIGRPNLRTASIFLLFAILFVAWLMYSAEFWFADAVVDFRDHVVRDPVAFMSPFGHASPAGSGRAEISLLTFAFLGILLLWLSSVMVRRHFWNDLSLNRLFPLLVISGLPILIMGTGNFTYEGFTRTYVYAIPFLAWFLARESATSKSSGPFLLALFSLGFVLLYAREFEELPSTQQFAGAGFLADNAEPDDTIIQGDCLSVGPLTNTIDAPVTNCAYPNPAAPELEQVPNVREFTFAVLSDFGERSANFSFAFGESWWECLEDSVQREGFAEVYSNGRYEIFAQPAVLKPLEAGGDLCGDQGT